MNYFDDLLESAHTLVRESAGVLDTTKTFRQALVQAKTVLERDYTPSDVAENLGDVDFANDFAEELHKTLSELKKVAEHVSNDCLQRKHRLDNALTGINKYFGDDKKEEDEELVELAGVTDAQLGEQFNQISDGCSNHFEAVSVNVDTVQNGIVTAMIEKIQSIKNVLLLRNKEDYTATKLGFMDVLDKARDVQLKVESAQYRLESNPHKINRYIGKKANWYYQHKYSTRTTTNCRDDAKIVKTEMDSLDVVSKTQMDLISALAKNTDQKMTTLFKNKMGQCNKIKNAEEKEPVCKKVAPFKSSLDATATEEELEEEKDTYAKKKATHMAKCRKAHAAWTMRENTRKSNLQFCLK